MTLSAFSALRPSESVRSSLDGSADYAARPGAAISGGTFPYDGRARRAGRRSPLPACVSGASSIRRAREFKDENGSFGFVLPDLLPDLFRGCPLTSKAVKPTPSGARRPRAPGAPSRPRRVRGAPRSPRGAPCARATPFRAHAFAGSACRHGLAQGERAQCRAALAWPRGLPGRARSDAEGARG